MNPPRTTKRRSCACLQLPMIIKRVFVPPPPPSPTVLCFQITATSVLTEMARRAKHERLDETTHEARRD